MQEKHTDHSHAQATKKGIPPGARWTKIDRRLVNPEALEAAHERFEERLDCVIVLRVLTKEEIQKLADRTREIRGKRHRALFATPEETSCLDGTASFDEVCEADIKPSSKPSSPLQRSDSDSAAISADSEAHAQEAEGDEKDGRRRRRAWTYHLGRGLRNAFIHSLTSYSSDQRYEEERTERKAGRRSQRNRDRRDRDEYEYSDSEDEFMEKAPKMLEAPSTAGASSNNADFIRENRDRRYERERESEPSYMSGGLGGGGRRDDSQQQARY